MHTFGPAALRGDISVPGDKSISHRALFVAAGSRESTRVDNLNEGRDVRATAEALRALGVEVDQNGGVALVRGARLQAPERTVDCMNSGSTARMLLGLCAGAGLDATLDGDESLRRRPMEPVAAQLRAFGARIETSAGRLPAKIEGTSSPQTRRFILLVPSAQIKTALLLAGLFSGVGVTTTADKGSRDHTERLLQYHGADITFDRGTVELKSPPRRYKDVSVPGDFSAAAFFIVGASIAPGSALRISDVGVNPTRTGLLEALSQMGASIELEHVRDVCREPRADIVVRYAPLRGIAIGPDLALRAIDEILVLAVAAAFAEGETRITGIRELRAKESDRVAAIIRLLDAVGIGVEHLPNGIAIRGGAPRARSGVVIETHDDHRTAMSTAMLASAAGPLAIDSASSIDVSFPDFLDRLATLQAP